VGNEEALVGVEGSRTSAGVTTVATSTPPESTSTWRLTPSTFLAPSNPPVPVTGCCGCGPPRGSRSEFESSTRGGISAGNVCELRAS
jgi:hypothetical protein